MPMRDLPAIETEVVVIGHGATGLFAAIELASTGHEVLLVGNGTPSSEMSTGCISFPEEAEWWRGLGLDDGLMQDASDRVDQGIQKALTVGPCTWEGTSEKRMALVTNLGTIIRTNYAPSTSSRHDIIAIRGAKVATLGFHGNKDLDPGLFNNMLRSEAGVEASSSWAAPVPAEPHRPHIEMNHGIRHSHDAFSEVTPRDRCRYGDAPAIHAKGRSRQGLEGSCGRGGQATLRGHHPSFPTRPLSCGFVREGSTSRLEQGT